MRGLALAIVMLFVTVPAYADQHSNEAEEDSKGDDFYNYSKD